MKSSLIRSFVLAGAALVLASAPLIAASGNASDAAAIPVPANTGSTAGSVAGGGSGLPGPDEEEPPADNTQNDSNDNKDEKQNKE